MRALVALPFRRLSYSYRQQNWSRHHFNPHLDYSNPLTAARALLDSSTRWSSATPSSRFFSSSLHGTEESEEVLDMEAGTVRCAANYAALSPISFIERAAAVYGARAAVVYGERRHTWAEARRRCVRVAAALATRFAVARGDVVSALPANLLTDE